MGRSKGIAARERTSPPCGLRFSDFGLRISFGFRVSGFGFPAPPACDLCAFCLRRMEEQKAGLPIKALDQHCIPWVKPLVHRGAEPLGDVLSWLQEQTKKGAAKD
jgi:hypothetical protein